MDSALIVQGRVIYALMMREVHTIYGTSRLGYLWALIQTMWGIGVFWGENVVHAYIRPQRYTKQFVDEQSCFSLSFFDGYKKELSVLGTVSGRNTCKIEDVDFHPVFIDGVPTFEEAKLVFIVEKIYEDCVKPENFIDTSLDKKWYPDKDYHHIYIAKIKGVYQKV